MPSIKKSFQLFQNMGVRYVAFRALHEVKKWTGIFQKQFPQNPPFQSFISLAEWRKQNRKFFVDGRLLLQKEFLNFAALKKDFHELKAGKIPFFSSSVYELGNDYDWVTNPDSGYCYDPHKHWTQINDYSKEAGDIKFVWEKSRFSFLYTIVRYDALSGEDNSEWVWKEILSWIEANPVNCGPNYKCSQEISLRVFNWTFALHFYKNSETLSEEVFHKIIFSIYWQLHHVYHNIHFSKIAVRNNHAITETLALYLGGLLFPFFPEATEWKAKGKNWFEEEIGYQVYEDGTFLQFSMNYHRVVVQLLTWAIRLADLNGERFKEVVYERARKSVDFLTNCMEPGRGWLPNYGANDGALFFKLNSNHYRDYRPQLEALSRTLGMQWEWGQHEDALWYGLSVSGASNNSSPVCHSEQREESLELAHFAKAEKAQDAASAVRFLRQHDKKNIRNLGRSKEKKETESVKIKEGSSQYPIGGYYLFRQKESFSFIRCGNHKDRPSQADNLHLDIWYKGNNVLHDGGSYKYNMCEKELKYFMGTRSHNTVMLDNFDQMEKGARFIWYHWTQCEEVRVKENEQFYQFEGIIKAFQHLDSKIRHRRKVIVYKDKPLWEVEDFLENKPKETSMKQVWHSLFPELLSFRAELAGGDEIAAELQEGLYSGFYGKKESCSEIVFSTKEDTIRTFLSIKE